MFICIAAITLGALAVVMAVYNIAEQRGYQAGKKDGYCIGERNGYEIGRIDGFCEGVNSISEEQEKELKEQALSEQLRE